VDACSHTDCAQTRQMAEAMCHYCSKPIGYDTPFYDVSPPGQPGGPMHWRLAHASCHEDAILKPKDTPSTDAPWAQRILDGLLPRERAKLVASQLALLRSEARERCRGVAAAIFRHFTRTGRQVPREIRVTVDDLTAMLVVAYECGYCSGVGEHALAVLETQETLDVRLDAR
jgi:hypothetical protein